MHVEPLLLLSKAPDFLGIDALSLLLPFLVFFQPRREKKHSLKGWKRPKSQDLTAQAVGRGRGGKGRGGGSKHTLSGWAASNSDSAV